MDVLVELLGVACKHVADECNMHIQQPRNEGHCNTPLQFIMVKTPLLPLSETAIF